MAHRSSTKIRGIGTRGDAKTEPGQNEGKSHGQRVRCRDARPGRRAMDTIQKNLAQQPAASAIRSADDTPGAR
jgi:hypothetical protein